MAMSQPAPYNRVTSFTTDQAQAPSTPLTGANFDAEFNAVKVTLDQVLDNLAVIQRDDTALANASVGLDQLDTTVLIGINPPTSWVTAHDYISTSDSVFHSQKLYRCVTSHTSGVFATDLAAGKWVLLEDFSATFGTATDVPFTPAQGVASTNVQAAIEEVAIDTVDLAGWRNDISGGMTTAGTSTAYTLVTGTPFVSLAAMSNQPIVFIPHTTSGVAPTLAVDGLAAKKIRSATGVDLTTGALLAGTPYFVVYYNGVGEFLLVGYTDVRNNVTVRGTLDVIGVQTYTAGATWNGTAAFNGVATFSATPIILSTDAGASIGPTLDLFRDSASPAGGDTIGSIDINGRDSAGNKQLYGRLVTAIQDPTSTSEDGSLFCQMVVGGALTTIWSTQTGSFDVNAGLIVHSGATVTGAVSGDTAAGAMVATQAEQETGSATDKLVTPGRQQFHQSAAKMWGSATVSSNVPTLQTGTGNYNITSITDTATGRLTITIATDFADTKWCCVCSCGLGVAGAITNDSNVHASAPTVAAGSIELSGAGTANTAVDPDVWYWVGFGDQ